MTRAICLALCLLAACALAPAAVAGTVPALAAATFVIAAVRWPDGALLACAALLPVAPAAAAALLGLPPRTPEIIPLALLCGLFFRGALLPSEAAAPRGFTWAAAALVGVVLASVIVQAALTGVVLSAAGFASAAAEYFRNYYDGSRTFPYAVAAAPMLIGTGLAVVVAGRASTPQASERLLRMLLTGGAAVAALNVARMTGALLRTGAPIDALPGALSALRISAPYGDPNATGSFFALLLPISVAMARAAHGNARRYYAALAVLHALALWMSGSRAALLSIAIVGCAAAIAHGAPGATVRRRVLLIGAAVVLLAVLARAFPNPVFDRQSTVGALGIRAEMARVAVRLWLTDPLLGVGIGRFLERSETAIEDPYVRGLYGRENAHNNFLQILAELGVLGAAAFALVVYTAVRASSPFALRWGLAAFMGTCLAGHPLLIPDVQLTFWMVLGAAAAWHPAGASARIAGALAAAIVLLTLVSIPISFGLERRDLSLDHLGHGVSNWRIGPDGGRYRRSEGTATVFVPTAARIITLAIRPAESGGLPITVTVWLNDRLADRHVVTEDSWRSIRLTMPPNLGPAYVALRVSAADSRGAAAPVLLQKVEVIR